MNTVLHTWSFRPLLRQGKKLTLKDMTQMAVDMGFGAMEIMAGKAGQPDPEIPDESLECLEKCVETVRDTGIEVTCLATYNDFAYTRDENWRQANLIFIRRYIRWANKVGVKQLRMLTGYYQEGEDRAHLERITEEGVAECAKVAEEENVTLAIENHNSIFMDAESLLGLIGRIGSSALTTCPDPTNWCNGFFKKDAEEQALVWKNEIIPQLKLVAPKATNSHLKVISLDGDDGLEGVDLRQVINVYKQGGYDGPIALEYIGPDPEKELPIARERVEAAIASA